MSIRDLALQTIESTLNTLIDLDGQAASKFVRFQAQVIAIQLKGTGITLYFVPDQSGHLQVLSRFEDEPDCTLAGSPLDLMRASDKEQGSAQLFAGHVTLTGDTELGHRFSEILGGLNIDWEEQLSKIFGDVAAHEAGRAAKDASNYGKGISDTLQENISEYLTEEARLLPHRYEVEDWLQDIERTRDDVERLAARISLLEKQS